MTPSERSSSDEYTKDLRDSQVSVDNLLYMIGEAAVLQLQGAPLGIDVEQFFEVISVLLSDKDPNEQKAIAPQVLKLSVFSSATMRGRIRFTHDAVHEFLVAEQAVQYFGRDPGRFVDLLNYAEFAPDSIALRIITNHIDSRGSGDEIVLLLYRARAGAHLTAFRNLVSIAVGLRDASALLADAPMTGLDLSGMTFANLALGRVDLTSANLQSVTFDRCDLAGLILVDAILDETRFVHCQSTLHAAEYGSMRGLMSVAVDGKRVDTSTAFVQMLRKAGRKAGATVDPCQTALRLRSLFKARNGPDGRPRRKHRNSLVKGAATSASAELLDHAVRAGFVARVHGKASYECVKGQQYQGVVGYVRSLEPTPEITALLEGLCPIKGCTHTGL